ncbi:MAG: hypothetical protein ACTS73_08795 [Arsenophonus sp. NEOnobi-MAG3]
MPKVRDRSGNGICFNSSLLPFYLKRAKKTSKTCLLARASTYARHIHR